MKLIIDIPEKTYNSVRDNILFAQEINSDVKWELTGAIVNGIPLDKIKAEIDQIEINGHIRDIECFSAGINTVLKIIDKYREEQE